MNAPADGRGRCSCGQSGFTLVEVMVSLLVLMSLMASVFSLLDPTRGVFRGQLEASTMQQRLRVATDAISAAAFGAGAGTRAGPMLGSFPPVMPYRLGERNSDPRAGVFYRPDAATFVHVPYAAPEGALRAAVAPGSTSLPAMPIGCPSLIAAGCGFRPNSRIVVFDRRGAFDVTTVAAADEGALQVETPVTNAYAAGAVVSAVVARTFSLGTDPSTGTLRLMQYDGGQSDQPVVDHVVSLQFEYVGDPDPPRLIAGLVEPGGPRATYGPSPPIGDVDDPNDSWPAGENCTFAFSDGEHVPRLAPLSAGMTYVPLPPGMLRDGPWCPDASHPLRFDADLLRIRSVTVHLVVQASGDSLRGPAGTWFLRGGTGRSASALVPDVAIRFGVTPRNLGGGR